MRPDPAASALLVFDLMDTVIADPFYREVPRYLKTTLEALLAVKHPTSWIEFETGLADEASFLGRFYREECGLVLKDPDAFREIFFSSYRFVEGMEALLGELKAHGRPLWVLSNYSRWVEIARIRLGLDRFFEGYCVSWQTGHRKPHPEAYRALVAQSGRRDCLLVDDRSANIEGARQAGLDGVLFTDTKSLRTELHRLGMF
jgi:putative hydrolase of the HAD superfamily